MTNFQVFKSLLAGYKPYFHRPKVQILEERNYYLKRIEDSWAYYDADERTIYVLKEHDNPIVRLHESGHWINACIYFSLEILWEFIWWGLGVRSLFRNKAIEQVVKEEQG